MTPFQEFRLWSRRAPMGQRVTAAVAAVVAVSALGWMLVPAGHQTASNAGSPGSQAEGGAGGASASGSGAGASATATTQTVAGGGQGPTGGPTGGPGGAAGGAAGKVHGYRADDLAGVSTFDFIHPEDRASVHAAFERLVKHKAKAEAVCY